MNKINESKSTEDTESKGSWKAFLCLVCIVTSVLLGDNIALPPSQNKGTEQSQLRIFLQ